MNDINNTNLDNNLDNNEVVNDQSSAGGYTYGLDSEAVSKFEEKYAEQNVNDGTFCNGKTVNNDEPISSMSWGGDSHKGAQYAAEQLQHAKSRNGKFVATVIICAVVSLAVGFGGGLMALSVSKLFNGSSENNASIVKQVTAEKEEEGVLTTESIVNAVADSVVEITTETVQTGSIFGDYIAEGAGSGIVISADGYIATNDHVIADANQVTVRLRNGQEYEAKLVGTDAQTDIALLKIEAQNLQAATFGDSDKLSVGEKAVVIGNPLGELGGTVSCGIISAVDREVTIDNQKKNLLQTDAAVNPGNSGGPLFDGQGHVVGMVEAKSSGTDIEGIGFVIPSNTVKTVLDELKANGRVTGRPYLGISMVDIATMQEAYQYNVNHAGTYIAQVVEGSVAEKGGLKQGDCIVKIDGEEVKDSADIKSRVSQKKVGDKITVTVLRTTGSGGLFDKSEEEQVDVEVVLGEQNDTANSSIKKYNKK